MAKKARKSSKKQVKSTIKAQTMIDRLPKNRVEWLELCIALTKRALDKSHSEAGMAEQLKRLEDSLFVAVNGDE